MKTTTSFRPLLACAILFSSALPFAHGVSERAAGTFFEEVRTVQVDKGKVVPGQAAVSIPYSRVDVAVENGVAMTRLLQIYHNHSASNQGFAFQMPLLPDTTITHFNLWDDGKRYEAAIEERTRTEQAYKEITGDEAPELRRDPGLVRRTANLYEMRVFPILPGENKQVELFYHRRLGMTEGEFVLDLPLGRIARPNDARHGTVASEITEVSVLLRDDLPIASVSMTGGSFEETVVSGNERLLKLRVNRADLADVQVRYKVAISGGTSVASQVFQQGDNRFFLMRILTARAESGPTPAAVTNRSFYMGVWHPGTASEAELESQPERMALEIAGIFTLNVFSPQDRFHGSYWLPRVEGKDVPKLFGLVPAVTKKWYRVAEAGQALEESFATLEKSSTNATASPPRAAEHLRQALQDGDCNLAYLFIDQLPAGDLDELAAIIRAHDKKDFILVTAGDDLPPALGSQQNVSHFSLRQGWRSMRYTPPDDQTQVLTTQEWGLSELLGAFGISMDTLTRFWEKLPNRGETLPTLTVAGQVRLRDVQVYSGNRELTTNSVSSTQPQVVWLTGRFEGTGAVNMKLTLPRGPGELGFMTDKREVVTYVADAKLDDTAKRSRLVGAFHARQLVDALNGQIQVLRQSPAGRRAALTGKEDEAKRLAKLESLRKEVVRLSKEFSFISSETAFIALPPDLQRKYGFTAQQQSSQQYYSSEAPAPMIMPEPMTWQLVALGAALIVFVCLKRRGCATGKTT